MMSRMHYTVAEGLRKLCAPASSSQQHLRIGEGDRDRGTYQDTSEPVGHTSFVELRLQCCC
jgi:hypothetical protein